MPAPRTLVVGQARQPTGMARVVRAIAGGLARHRDVHVLGIDAPGASGAAAHEPGGWTLHPNPRPVDVFAELALAELVPALRPRSVLLCHDAWFVPRMRRAIGGGPAVAAYCPIDGALLRPDIVAGLSAFDALAVPSDFSRRQVLTAAADLGLADRPPFRGMAVVPHGVDRAVFGPRGGTPDDVEPRRIEARRALFPGSPALWRGFWVLNANRNQARKRIDLTLRGFALFAEAMGPDVRLHVHWGADGPGVDVAGLARHLGIAARLVVTPEAGGVPTDRLNLVYNAADVGINTSLGEGWGLVSLEHAATGAAQVVPAHSACAELWDGAAELLPVARLVSPAGVVRGGEVDPAGVAAALGRLHGDRGHYLAMVRRAFERAADPALRWDAIGDAWHVWLSDLEAGRRCSSSSTGPPGPGPTSPGGSSPRASRTSTCSCTSSGTSTGRPRTWSAPAP